MDRYVEISRIVRRVFESFSPAVEPLSLDEAFLDLAGTEKLLGTPLEVGAALCDVACARKPAWSFRSESRRPR